MAPNLSWNTFLSRTSISSLSSAAFSDPSLSGQVHGLDDVLNTVKALSLPRFQYGEIERQDVVGQGETFIVERCVVRNQVLAMKHLKTNVAPDDGTFRRRLQSVILELRIMRHAPLRSHPNILAVFGYGWNMKATQIVPYLLVQYAPYGTLREYLRHFKSEISMVHKEILLGDVAAATSTLHLCGIIHGDIKLDNVLVFHSWDRPTKSIAKIADFGHSLITTGKEDSEQAYIRYGGTFMLVPAFRSKESSLTKAFLDTMPPRFTTRSRVPLIELRFLNAMYGLSGSWRGRPSWMVRNMSSVSQR